MVFDKLGYKTQSPEQHCKSEAFHLSEYSLCLGECVDDRCSPQSRECRYRNEEPSHTPKQIRES